MFSELNGKLANPQLTTNEYAVTLTYSQYVSTKYWNPVWVIPESDIEEYGIPVSVMLRNSDASAGSAAFNSNSQRSCTLAGNSTSATVIVSYLKF